MNEPGIHLFRELKLTSPAGVNALKEALVAQACEPWKHASAEELLLYRVYPPSFTVAMFARGEFGSVEPCMLTLLTDRDGLKLTNIYPRKVLDLGPARYNSIILDFLTNVVEPARLQIDICVELGREFLSLRTALGQDAASALIAFSKGANKSTGSAHPLDRKRWFDFLLALHKAPRRPGLEQIQRWLVESEGWSEEAADQLIRECQFSLDLLMYQDKQFP